MNMPSLQMWHWSSRILIGVASFMAGVQFGFNGEGGTSTSDAGTQVGVHEDTAAVPELAIATSGLGGGVFGPAMTGDVAALNDPGAAKARWNAAVSATVQPMELRHLAPEGELGTSERAFLRLLLRTTTGNLPGRPALPEPYADENARRANGGCDDKDPGCLITWDGWARSTSAGEVLYDVLRRDVPGSVAEVGVFKGGLAAYLQGVLIATGEAAKGREMWLVDSFQGLPPTSLMTSANDKSGSHLNSHKNQAQWAGALSVGQRTVRDNLDRMGLLDPGNVRFLEGWVQDTLPGWGGGANATDGASTKPLALLRVDVDIYSATYDALHFLYPHLEKGGAVLFDDWKFNYSREAVMNYRKEHGIATPVRFLHGCIDPMAYWIKE